MKAPLEPNELPPIPCSVDRRSEPAPEVDGRWRLMTVIAGDGLVGSWTSGLCGVRGGTLPASQGVSMILRSWHLGPCAVLTMACVAILGCSSPTSSRLNLHVEVADAAGDAPTSGVVPNPPDLVRATVDVYLGDVTFAIRFAPGWDQATAFLTIDLDVDQNANTGVPSGGIGVEYEVGPTSVVRFDGMSATVVGTPSVTVLADGMNLRMPLSLLGGDDGQMNFRARVHHSLQPAFDFLPDLNLAAARVE